MKNSSIKMPVSSLLFEPIKIGSLELTGRMVKSATVETKCTRDGFITDELIQYYEEIAQGGTPLIITGATSFNQYSRGVPFQISIDADDKIEGLKRLADTVHKYDSKIMMQIYHTARQASLEPVGRIDAQAPSAVFEPTLGVKPRAMSVKEIQEAVILFADAAERCKKAEMDGIQIHAAHGYLISSFLTPHTNRRKDEYGGTFEKRMRFLLEVYHAIRERVGEDYPIIMKINGSDDLPLRKGLSTQDLVLVAKRMEDEGISAVEITAGHYESCTTFERGNWSGYTKATMTVGPGQSFGWWRRNLMLLFAPIVDAVFNKVAKFSEGFNLDYAKEFKTALNIPVICVGGLSNKGSIQRALEGQQCDMVSVARALVADPYLYRHLKEGVAGPECDYCNRCFTMAGVAPIACGNEKVNAQRIKMIESESLSNTEHIA